MAVATTAFHGDPERKPGMFRMHLTPTIQHLHRAASGAHANTYGGMPGRPAIPVDRAHAIRYGCALKAPKMTMPHPPQRERWLTVPDVADALQMSEETV